MFVCRWSKTPVQTRAKILAKIADLIDENLDELATAESTDQGKPVALARRMDIPRAALNFRAFAESISHQLNMYRDTLNLGCCSYKYSFSCSSNHFPEVGCVNYTVRHPVGVAALISPWNLPLYLLTFKIAPAIATGSSAD